MLAAACFCSSSGCRQQGRPRLCWQQAAPRHTGIAKIEQACSTDVSRPACECPETAVTGLEALTCHSATATASVASRRTPQSLSCRHPCVAGLASAMHVAPCRRFKCFGYRKVYRKMLRSCDPVQREIGLAFLQETPPPKKKKKNLNQLFSRRTSNPKPFERLV